jgi:hypothetical protein
MASTAQLDLDVVEVKFLGIAAEPAGETIVTFELVGGDLVDVHLSPHAWAMFEALLAQARAAQGSATTIQ